MANISRKLGVNICAFMQKTGLSLQSFAEHLGYTIKDAGNIIEGKILIPPTEVERISELLGTTKGELLSHETDILVPELEYMKEFSNPDNLDKILDLMDEYVECKEVM